MIGCWFAVVVGGVDVLAALSKAAVVRLMLCDRAKLGAEE